MHKISKRTADSKNKTESAPSKGRESIAWACAVVILLFSSLSSPPRSNAETRRIPDASFGKMLSDTVNDVVKGGKFLGNLAAEGIKKMEEAIREDDAENGKEEKHDVPKKQSEEETEYETSGVGIVGILFRATAAVFLLCLVSGIFMLEPFLLMTAGFFGAAAVLLRTFL